MFKRVRQLRISLAAKCQLLFGAAVILIISAALFVPWHRIEQLTEQLNERAASALAEEVVARHITSHSAAAGPAGAQPTTGASAAGPATRPATSPAIPGTAANPRPAITARVARLNPKRDSQLGLFEFRAMSHFRRHPESKFYSAYYTRVDGTHGYRYAQPLYLAKTSACVSCHAAAAPIETEPATLTSASPASAARTDPALLVPLDVDPNTKRAGLVSVDFVSRIDANELLLNRIFLLFAGLLAGFLAIVTFYFITTRLILQPVRVLQETAEKVSKGDLNIRSDISTGDEFQQLSETFNTMLTNLKRNADQLRAINKSLDLKLGQLAETNVALYESNRLKSEFLANVSHELRTPLNSILGFADLLKDSVVTAPVSDGRDPGPGGKSARYVNNILQSGRNLLDLINDLLDLAKIEAGRMEIRSEPLSLSDLFEGLVTILKPLADPKRVPIVASVATDVPIIQTDPGKLQQVLYNFLSNAIKFSPPHSPIELTAHRDGEDHVRISVSDRGPGIAAEQQQVIFEKFRQIDGSVTRSQGGTGLGLAISKELTTLVGGSIGVRSTPGEGATFWVVLPLKIQSGQADMRGRLVLT